jgi:protein-ribulosamine 3-kinase
MCEGEYELLKAIYAVSPSFVPKPYAWGKYEESTPETYFLQAAFRDVGEQVRVEHSSWLGSVADLQSLRIQ